MEPPNVNIDLRAELDRLIGEAHELAQMNQLSCTLLQLLRGTFFFFVMPDRKIAQND